MRKEVKTLLVLCFVGTGIAIVGAALRTSNIQEREELGVLIHRGGMTVMLVGFAGLFFLRKGKQGSRNPEAFRWSDAYGKLRVTPVSRREVLDVSVVEASNDSVPDLDACELDEIRCVIARGRPISKEFISRLAKLQQVRILDLQNAILDDGVLQELEALECLEVILLAGCVVPSQTKELRMTLPEAKMIFEPRETIISRS